MATGVNALRPRDAIADHQAVRVISPTPRPTAAVSAAGTSEKADQLGDPDASDGCHASEGQGDGDRDPDIYRHDRHREFGYERLDPPQAMSSVLGLIAASAGLGDLPMVGRDDRTMFR
jgi:hypothetical protein